MRIHHLAPGLVVVGEQVGEIGGEPAHVGLAAGLGELHHIGCQSGHVVEQGLNARLLLGKMPPQRLDVRGQVLLFDAQVVVGKDGAVEMLDFPGSRESGYGRRGIAAGLVMLLQDQRLEALTGEGRGAA